MVAESLLVPVLVAIGELAVAASPWWAGAAARGPLALALALQLDEA
jgi:hypothetical protein